MRSWKMGDDKEMHTCYSNSWIREKYFSFLLEGFPELKILGKKNIDLL